MKRILWAVAMCLSGSCAAACDVAVGSVSAPVAVAPQAVVVQAQGFALAVPTVTAFASPIVVQSQAVVVQSAPLVVQTRVVRRGRIVPRTRVVTRVVR